MNIDPDKACGVEGADVIRVCDFFGKPLVMSFWFTKGGYDCIDQQDVFDDVARKFKGRVGMLSINVRDDRDQVRDLIADHGWTAPNGYDRDGAVSNIYRVGVCPTFIYVKPGGVMKDASTRVTSVAELSARDTITDRCLQLGIDPRQKRRRGGKQVHLHLRSGKPPLTQLTVLVGSLLIGFITGNKVQMVVGLILGSLGGFELAVREHFAGYRSHTTLLAGVAFVITTGLIFFVAKWVLWQALLIGLVVGAGVFWLRLQRFRMASGGLSYRVR